MSPKTATISPSVFARTQISLLAAEQASEVAETTLLLSDTAPTILARSGLAVLNLAVQSQRTGLGGKTVIELGQDSAIAGLDADLPEHGIRTGDIVRLSEQPKGDAKKKERSDAKAKGAEGVVTRVGQRAIWVALGKGGGGDDDYDVPAGKLWLVKLANDVTYKRMNQIMTKMSKMSDSEFSSLTRVLFGLSSPSPPDLSSMKDIEFIDPTLNDSQKHAIRFALASSEVALIHGPPGTGKTHTLIELILQMLKCNLRILVCGPSNISVDNIVERLAPHKVPIVRLGHPARLLPSVLNHSLEVLTKTSEQAAIVQDVRKDMDDKQASIRKTKSGRERKAIYQDLKELRKEYRQREDKCVNNLVRGSKVVLATLHGAGGHQLKNQEFDVVIIDEASQALEAQCWVPLLSARKAVLAGDHLQLPPTVKSSNNKNKPEQTKDLNDKTLSEELSKLSLTPEETKAAKSLHLEHTMFDRLLSLHGPSIKTLLNTQYRMHEKIMRFPSDELYSSELIAAEHVKSRLLTSLKYPVTEMEDTIEPLIFFDTQGGDFPENITEDTTTSPSKKSLLLGDSRSNSHEASLVARHVHHLTSAGVLPADIAVITPYNAQLSLLSSLLKEKYPDLELGSVDGFQGREKEAIVLSLVRSNPEHEVGFLAEKRRLNVAMTRPRRHLCVVGDSETIGRGGGGFLKRWMAYLEAEADLRYPGVEDLQDV